MSVELDELVSMVSGSDQQILKDILGRNPNASTRIETSSTLYKAFVDGDDATVDRTIDAAKLKAAADAAAARRANNPLAGAQAQFDLAELEKLADKRAEEKFRALTTSEEYQKAEEEKVTKIVKKITDELAPQLLSNAARTSDEIYQVRRSHEEEFGTKLNTEDFTKFINENANKFANLSAAHDAFVSKERIDAQIAKGIAEGRKAEDDKKIEVPGTSLGTSQTVLGSMMRANKTMTAGESERGPALDAAARAFRSLRVQHAE